MPSSARMRLGGGRLFAGSPRSAGMEASSRRRQLALTALTLAIVAFCAVAFVRTQVLKQEEPPIAGIEVVRQLRPGCDCPRESARLSFVLRHAQPLTATIVDEADQPVRTLLEGALRGSGRQTLTWDGTDDAGRVVAGGDYRLRLDLAEPDRTIVIPDRLEVEAAAASETSNARLTGAG